MTTPLGRGLSSLIPPKENKATVAASVAASAPALQAASSVEIRDLQLGDIYPNPDQPRRHFEETALAELAQSIAQHGLLEPIVVTPDGDDWMIVAGERRYRAFESLGKESIPSIIRSTSELERLELGLIENIQRHDLNPMEKAFSYAKLVGDFGLTQVEASKKLGIPRSSLANTIRLTELPTAIQQGLVHRKITEGHAKVLLGVEDADTQIQLFERMTNGAAMSVRELREELEASVGDTTTGGAGTASKRRAVINHELLAVQDDLEAALSSKVRLKKKASGTYQITIDTFSADDFKSVVKKLLAE